MFSSGKPGVPGAAYCGTSTLWTVIGFLGNRLNSHNPQEAPLKPPPTLAPVATPRASASSPKLAPDAPEKEAALYSTLGQPNALPAIDPGSPRFAGVAPAPAGLACGHVSISQVCPCTARSQCLPALNRQTQSQAKMSCDVPGTQQGSEASYSCRR